MPPQKSRIVYPKGDEDVVNLEELVNFSVALKDSAFSRALCVLNPQENRLKQEHLQHLGQVQHRRKYQSEQQAREFFVQQFLVKSLDPTVYVTPEKQPRETQTRLPWIQRGQTMHVPRQQDTASPLARARTFEAGAEEVKPPENRIPKRVTFNKRRDKRALFPRVQELLTGRAPPSPAHSRDQLLHLQRLRQVLSDQRAVLRQDPSLANPHLHSLLKGTRYLPAHLQVHAAEHLRELTALPQVQAHKQQLLARNRQALRREATIQDPRWDQLCGTLQRRHTLTEQLRWQKQAGFWVKAAPLQ